MKKTIKIDIMTNDDLYESYNKEKVSHELINYIIESSEHLRKKDEIEIIINNHTSSKDKCIFLIENGLKEEIEKSKERHTRTNIIQVVYFIFGIFALTISTQIPIEIFRELTIICGWVLMWTIIELEMFDDVAERKKRQLLRKLLKSKFIERER